MSMTVESLYKDLLVPIKDPEKSFAVNIAELLEDYLSNLLQGNVPPNFNCAGLIVQGSSSIYGKKVEYLHDLVLQLVQTFGKKYNAAEQQSKKETHTREKKEGKTAELFFSTYIKPGKNLSCLKKKASPKLNLVRKSSAAGKKKTYHLPMHLLPFDNEEKGDPFYDTKGDIIGNKGEYALDLCRLTTSGWLALPTINSCLLNSQESSSSSSSSNTVEPMNIDQFSAPSEVQNNNCDDNIPASPYDEGFGSCPTNSDCPPSSNGIGSQQTPSQEIPNSVPPSTDEGIGSTPNEVDSCHSPGTSEGIENVPASNENAVTADPALIPVRNSTRQALTPCQLMVEEDPLAMATIDPELLRPKRIQKKNTVVLPESLKDPSKKSAMCSVSEFCAQNFFSLEGRITRNTLLKFDVAGFDQNSRFLKKMADRTKVVMTGNKKSTGLEPIMDVLAKQVEGDFGGDVDVCRSAQDDSHPDNPPVQLDDADIVVDSDPISTMAAENPEINTDLPAAPNLSSQSFDELSVEQQRQHELTLMRHIENPELTERINAWESQIKPFLEEVGQRESFDINCYGSRILNSFEDNNRKQTMTFRQLCKDKEKWEIHRYFMALLPLANIGNVDIEKEPREDGSDEIFVSLLSRKMHHKELEEFGHNDGSHD